jgi:D-ribose pyranase
VVEHSWVTDQVREINPTVYTALRSFGLDPEPLDHDEFKVRVRDVKFAVRTGEDSFPSRQRALPRRRPVLR